MNISRAIAATALLAGAMGHWSWLHAEAAPLPSSASCGPANGWNLICGNPNPEDLVPIPGTRWLIASGMKEGAGLKFVDTDAKTARVFYTGQPAQQRPDTTLFPNCPAPPDAKTFNAHGLYLRRAQAPGTYKLYVVSHGALESIQVFTVDGNGVATLFDVDRVRSHARRKQGLPELGRASDFEPPGSEFRCGVLGRHHHRNCSAAPWVNQCTAAPRANPRVTSWSGNPAQMHST